MPRRAFSRWMRAALLTLLLASCTAAEQAPPAAGPIVETGVIFTAERTAQVRPDGTALPAPYWTPSAADVAAAEARMAALFASMSNEKAYRISNSLPAYRRQYLGYSMNGRKFILVNAFCEHYWNRDTAWHGRLVEVDDGGTCFFRLHFDVEADRVDDLRINGDG